MKWVNDFSYEIRISEIATGKRRDYVYNIVVGKHFKKTFTVQKTPKAEEWNCIVHKKKQHSR